ncbi:Tubulin polyglutamylase TTLL4 [Halotydeus destructor]|nr:Tubulin polyglutamylase TTLL4 [Halotydeus destructor]
MSQIAELKFGPEHVETMKRVPSLHREHSSSHRTPPVNSACSLVYENSSENEKRQSRLYHCNINPKYDDSDDVFYTNDELNWQQESDKRTNRTVEVKFVTSANGRKSRETSLPLCQLARFPRALSSNGSIKFLQPSLFPNCSPTIYFGTEEETIVGLPKELRHHLKWKLSSITPGLIKDTVCRSGFRLIKEKQKSRRWLGTWCKHIKSGEFGPFADFQKVNHFAGSFHCGRKDKLWFNLSAKAAKHGDNVFLDFHPRTYVLPQDLRELRKSFINSQGIDSWKMILKPPASARGNGISVISKWSQLPKNAKVSRKSNSNKPTLIAQDYISRPLLLFNGAKFDLRLYVLVTSFCPLRAYVFDDGLVRFASIKYDSHLDSLDEPFMHLTNYSINKNNEKYTSNNDTNGLSGHKWTLKTLWRHFEESYKGLLDICLLKRKINDMIIKTLIACEDPIAKLFRKHSKSRYTCFELLGFDIMLDEQFKPWLLEVNISPSLRSESSLDTAVKGSLIKDMLNIVGYQLPSFLPEELSPSLIPPEWCQLDSFHLSQKLSLIEREKRCHAIMDPNLNLLENLTPDDVRLLIETEDEMSRSGQFVRVFPTADTRTYLKYISPSSLYYNRLLADWEETYAFRKHEGIELLQSLCEEKYHLRRDESLTDRLIAKWTAIIRKARRKSRKLWSKNGPDDSSESATEVDGDVASGGRSSEASGNEATNC